MSVEAEKVKAVVKGLWRSWTVWFAGVLAAAPIWLPMLKDNFEVLAPFIPVGKQQLVIQIIALCVFVLRLKTTTSVAQKGSA